MKGYQEVFIKRLLIVLGVIFLLVYTFVPFGWMLIISFAGEPDFLAKQPIKITLTLKNYIDLFTNRTLYFVEYFRNSLIVASIVSVVSTVLGALSAYAITRMGFPGRIFIPTLALALSMFPQVSIVGYLYKMMSSLGLINTYPALIMPYIAWTIPLALWILLSYFSQIPKDLDKAGYIDGANSLQVLFKIILPLALPGLFATVLLTFIASFNEFMFAYLLTTDYNAQTITVGIASFQGLHGQIPWGYVMAASSIISIPLIILTLIFQKYVVQGLTAGSLKE